jgi:hypothetical protein
MVDEEIARHEAAHAVVARALGIQVLLATAGEDARVRTRYQDRDLEKIVTIDLAGLAMDASPEAASQDLRNATEHAERVVLMRHGTDRLTPDLRDEVTALVGRLRSTASTMVKENSAAIERVAAALAKGDLDQAGVDAAMATDALTFEEVDEVLASGAPELAAAFLQATEDFVESLQQISMAAGPWHEDVNEHAVMRPSRSTVCQMISGICQ